MGHCECDPVTPDRFFCICLMPFSGQGRMHKTEVQQRLVSCLPAPQRYEQLKLFSVDLYMSSKSAPVALRRMRICPTCVGYRQLQEPAPWPVLVSAPGSGSISICFLSFSPLFIFVHRLMAGCFSKIQALPQRAHIP